MDDNLITDERAGKPDILVIRDEQNVIRHAEIIKNRFLVDYLHLGHHLDNDHLIAADIYRGWKGAYDRSHGCITRKFDEIAGLSHIPNRGADRYIHLVMRVPRLKLDLIAAACFLPSSPAGREHCDRFFMSYVVAFDTLAKVVDEVSDIDLN